MNFDRVIWFSKNTKYCIHKKVCAKQLFGVFTLKMIKISRQFSYILSSSCEEMRIAFTTESGEVHDLEVDSQMELENIKALIETMV